MRERHGMPLAEENEVKIWKKNRCRRWEKHLKKEARARGEQVSDDDPRFKVCFDEPKTPLPEPAEMRIATPAKAKTEDGKDKAPTPRPAKAVEPKAPAPKLAEGQR
jgi:hypothetical protein